MSFPADPTVTPPGEPLSRSWFARHPVEIAFALIGAIVVVERDNTRVAARIVETEAYGGPEDLASHATMYRTGRETLAHDADVLYMQLAYGMHTMTNIVAHKPGGFGAVLLRAAEDPIDGLELVRELVSDLPQVVSAMLSRILARVATLPIAPPSDISVIPLENRRAELPDWLLPRRTIGAFYVVRSLGSGGACSVFMARRVEERNNAKAEGFALKVPDYDPTTARSLSEQEFLQLFREEAGALPHGHAAGGPRQPDGQAAAHADVLDAADLRLLRRLLPDCADAAMAAGGVQRAAAEGRRRSGSAARPGQSSRRSGVAPAHPHGVCVHRLLCGVGAHPTTLLPLAA